MPPLSTLFFFIHSILCFYITFDSSVFFSVDSIIISFGFWVLVGSPCLFRGTVKASVMAGGEENNKDYYAVLGLNKECSASDLRDAYKKLAMRWHPDRCSSSGNPKKVEESKKKFQTIQQAYSVLSDTSKRLMYDVRIYESDDDDSGMSDFLSEMAVMMSETQSNENGEETFEQLQDLFDEMLADDVEAFAPTSSSPSPYMSYRSGSNVASNNNGSSSGFNSGHFPSFCLGVGDGAGSRPKEASGGRRNESKRHHRRRQL